MHMLAVWLQNKRQQKKISLTNNKDLHSVIMMFDWGEVQLSIGLDLSFFDPQCDDW